MPAVQWKDEINLRSVGHGSLVPCDGVIVELAMLRIVPGQEDAFASAFPRGREILARADGFGWLTLHRGLERPNIFFVQVGWASVDHHLSFQQTALYKDWRAIVSPFLADSPQVDHLVTIYADPI